MRKTKSEIGRSLLETLAVLVVMALLLLSGITGYNFVIHKWKKDQTVKQITELAVRYKLRPVITKEDKIDIKDVYPEAERATAVQMKTADTDTGRVSLVVSSSEAFSVVINEILDDSCEAMLERGEYDGVLVDGKEMDGIVVGEGDVVIGQKFLRTFDYSVLTNEEKEALRSIGINQNTSKEGIIEILCAADGNGKLKNMALIYGENCPKTGLSYWYYGKCHACPRGQREDKFHRCCDENALNDCGICQDKTKECRQEPQSCGDVGSTVCDKDTKTCVECVEDKECQCRNKGKGYCVHRICAECKEPKEKCTTKVNDVEVTGYCTRRYTCEPCDEESGFYQWNEKLEICECKTPLLGLGVTCPGECCATGTFCHKFAEDDVVCTGCLYSYDGTHKGHEYCPKEKPFCRQIASDKSAKSCAACPALGTVEGATCSTAPGCHGCLATNEDGEATGLACDETSAASFGVCKCPAGQKWNATLKRCSECVTDADCNGKPKSACDTSTGVCVCPTDRPYFIASKNKCMACYVNDDGSLPSPGCPTSNTGAAQYKTYCNEAGNGGYGVCACPTTKPGYDAPCNTTCGCAAGYTCVSNKCKCSSGFWSTILRKCVSCLVNRGSGNGACTDINNPICDTEVGTCGPCPDGREWSDDTNECVCDSDKPGVNQSCTSDCGCASNLTCDSTSKKCKCPSGKYWNETAGKCTTCLVDYGKGTGACSNVDEPICEPKEDNSDWVCSSCESEFERYDTVKQECACLDRSGYNEGCGCCLENAGLVCDETAGKCLCEEDGYTWDSTEGKCVECTADSDCADRTDGKIICDQSTKTCTCPSGTYWDDNLKHCVHCLRNYGEEGTGACTTLQKPMCTENTAHTDRTCEPCDTGTFWNEEENTCTACLVNYGKGTGACPTLAEPICNSSWTCEACPSGQTYNQTTGECEGAIIAVDTVIYNSKPKNICGCAKEVSKNVKFPVAGYYHVTVVGAGGGSSGGANGHHKTNYGMGGTGGSGASFQALIKIDAPTTIKVKVGNGGAAYNKNDGNGYGGTGGTSSINGIVECYGGTGGYSGGRHTHSPGSGGAKCKVLNSSKVTKVYKNVPGNRGCSDYCRHTHCHHGICGSSPAITTPNNAGGCCSGEVSFASKHRFMPQGNCGYVKIVYKGPLQ